MVVKERFYNLECEGSAKKTEALQAGKKLDTGKSPLLRGCFSYFPNALEAVGKVSQYGAQKYNLEYEDRNWARVEGGLGRYGDALARHVTRHAGGESHDQESHLLHLAHAAWNALAVLELVLKQEPLVELPPSEEVTNGDPFADLNRGKLNNELEKLKIALGPHANSNR